MHKNHMWNMTKIHMWSSYDSPDIVYVWIELQGNHTWICPSLKTNVKCSGKCSTVHIGSRKIDTFPYYFLIIN